MDLESLPNKVLVPGKIEGDEHFWETVWFILAETCGAPNTDLARYSFVKTMQDGCSEYRFQGALGFGGKIYNSFNRLYVDCYIDDATEERKFRMKCANDALRNLLAEVSG